MADEWLTIGNKLGLLREHFGLSQSVFAEVLSALAVESGANPVSRSTIAAYETRKNANPSDTRARLWARKLGVPYEWFLDGRRTPLDVPRDFRLAIDQALASERSDRQLEAHIALTEEGTTLYSESEPKAIQHSSGHAPIPEGEDFPSVSTISVVFYHARPDAIDECHFKESDGVVMLSIPAFLYPKERSDEFIFVVPMGESMAPRIVWPDRLLVRLTANAWPGSIVVARQGSIDYIKILRLSRDGRRELHAMDSRYPPVTEFNGWNIRGVVVAIWKPYEELGPNIEFQGGLPLKA